MIATLLLTQVNGASWPISTFLVLAALVSVGCVALTKETAGKSLT
jgi:hypothetical protein